MSEYVCHYLTDATHSTRAVYHADELPRAMAMHNAALPEYRDKVLKWVGPTGINFQMHDSKLTLEPAPQPRSGYTPCACRDCMEITVSSDMSKPELCSDCKDAGCEAYPAALAVVDHVVTPADIFECQRDDAYGEC